jgi:hypothetical protein
MSAMFENWCLLHDRKALPAAPSDVAAFVATIAPMGIEKVWPIIGEISRAHYMAGLADPTLGGPVALAVNDIAKIKPPLSWPEDQRFRFVSLPHDLQKFLSAQDKRQNAVVRAAMSVAADARREANLPKLPKKFYRDATKVKHGNSEQDAAA